MLKIENTEVIGWEAAIRGMRNPMNSWAKSDSKFVEVRDYLDCNSVVTNCLGNISDWNGIPEDWLDGFYIGVKDLDLMKRLAANGPVHAKYRRMITVYCDITAPLYWWKEFDTYKVGTVRNSCSTMHKITSKVFTLDDFSCEHLFNDEQCGVCTDLGDLLDWGDADEDILRQPVQTWLDPTDTLKAVIAMLNKNREWYLKTMDKRYWWQLIQLLPSSYNQRATVMLNYEVLAGIYQFRKDHKLDEWHTFCDWIKTLPYSELITGEKKEE